MTFSNTADRRLDNKKKLTGLWEHFRIGLTIATILKILAFCALFLTFWLICMDYELPFSLFSVPKSNQEHQKWNLHHKIILVK